MAQDEGDNILFSLEPRRVWVPSHDRSNQELIRDVLSDPKGNPNREVRTKSQAYALFHGGFFGNKPKTWNSLEEALDSDWQGRFCIRARKGSGRFLIDNEVPLLPKYNRTREELPLYVEMLKARGISVEDLTFNQDLPDGNLKIQGEVQKSEGRILLTYTTVKEPMNDALLVERLGASGKAAKKLLQKNLWPRSLDDLDHCLSHYSTGPLTSAAVEFSSYDVAVGSLPSRNTIIWEVRNF